VVTGGEATVVIPPDFRFRVDGHRNIVASPRRASGRGKRS